MSIATESIRLVFPWSFSPPTTKRSPSGRTRASLIRITFWTSSLVITRGWATGVGFLSARGVCIVFARREAGDRAGGLPLARFGEHGVELRDRAAERARGWELGGRAALCRGLRLLRLGAFGRRRRRHAAVDVLDRALDHLREVALGLLVESPDALELVELLREFRAVRPLFHGAP